MNRNRWPLWTGIGGRIAPEWEAALLRNTHHFQNVNNSWLKMHGYSTKDEILGKHFSVTQANVDLNKAQEYVNFLLSGNSIPVSEFSRLCKDGTVAYHIFSSSPVYKDLKIIGIEGFILDTTEMKIMEEERNKLKDRLESLWKLSFLVNKDYTEICNFILDEVKRIAQSEYAFFGFIDENKSNMEIYSWSKEALSECSVSSSPIHFPVEKAGSWAEAIRTNNPIIINNYNDSHIGKTGLPEGHVNISRFAAVPIFHDNNIVSLVAVANKPTDYTNDDIKQIDAFTTNAHIVLQRKSDRDKIEATSLENELLLKELNHRVKNNMQVIISLMRLQSDKINDEEQKSHFLETQNRIYAMSAVHETLHQSENLSSVDLSEYLTKLSDTTFNTYRTDGENIQFSAEIQSIPVDLEKSYPIGLVINELLSNALKYAFPDSKSGEISILGELDGNTARLLVSDTGVGIPQDFDWRNAESLGLQITRSLVEDQLRGTIDLDRIHGTRWTITFPV